MILIIVIVTTYVFMYTSALLKLLSFSGSQYMTPKLIIEVTLHDKIIRKI